MCSVGAKLVHSRHRPSGPRETLSGSHKDCPAPTLTPGMTRVFLVSAPPIATGTETTILSNLTNTSTGLGAYQSILGSQTSWPGTFKVDAANTTLGAPTCTINYTGNTLPLPTC